MILKRLGPDLIRAGYRFSEKIMLHQSAAAGDDDSKKVIAAPGRSARARSQIVDTARMLKGALRLPEPFR
jgi:hypothetical protein